MTTAYASPEQVRGDRSPRPISTRFGVVLFELVTERRPYATRLGTSAQLETAIAEGRLIRAADAAITDADASAHSDTRRALARRQLHVATWAPALDKDPATGRRPALITNAEAMSRRLRRLLDGRRCWPHQTSRWQRTWKFVRRHRVSVA